jgi:hypothetical protein
VLLGGMYGREKQIGPYRYLYLVESVREGGRTRQRIIKDLGRKEQSLAKGDLDRLARSAARMAQRSMILSLLDQGSAPALATRRIGPPLAFERLWRETGCQAVIGESKTWSPEPVRHRVVPRLAERGAGCLRNRDARVARGRPACRRDLDLASDPRGTSKG